MTMYRDFIRAGTGENTSLTVQLAVCGVQTLDCIPRGQDNSHIAEKLKIGVMTSRPSSQSFMAFEYFSDRFSMIQSRFTRPRSSLGALRIVLKSLAKAIRSLVAMFFKKFLCRYTMQRRYFYLQESRRDRLADSISPSAQMIWISLTPRFFRLLRMGSQYLALSLSPA